MDIENNIVFFQREVSGKGGRLIAVSKTNPPEKINLAYAAGQRLFGENKVQEMVAKYEALPKDIEWHMIGHLQSNKVKYIAPFVSLIHSVDSLKLLEEINKQGKKNNRIIPCLLQVHIAFEEAKFGFEEAEVLPALENRVLSGFENIAIQGLMGMASLTQDSEKIKGEFRRLKTLFETLKKKDISKNVSMRELSMGMSSDFALALEEGSTLVRIGSAIFGERN
jgi:PLP dependent protein